MDLWWLTGWRHVGVTLFIVQLICFQFIFFIFNKGVLRVRVIHVGTSFIVASSCFELAPCGTPRPLHCRCFSFCCRLSRWSCFLLSHVSPERKCTAAFQTAQRRGVASQLSWQVTRGGAALPVQSCQWVQPWTVHLLHFPGYLSLPLSVLLSPPSPHFTLTGLGSRDSANMDPSETSGGDKEKEKEKVIKRRNRPVFLRYLERRKTDTIVAEDMAKGDINLGTLIRRSQSDKTEYSAKLKGTQKKALPQGGKTMVTTNIHTHTQANS